MRSRRAEPLLLIVYTTVRPTPHIAGLNAQLPVPQAAAARLSHLLGRPRWIAGLHTSALLGALLMLAADSDAMEGCSNE